MNTFTKTLFSLALLQSAAEALHLGSTSGSQPNPPTWGDSVKIIESGDANGSTCQDIVNNVWFEMGDDQKAGVDNHGQFSDSRYALFFKPGYHNCDVNVGFYTQVVGLGTEPHDTVLKNIYSPDAATGNALDNFWRGVENIEVGNNVSDKDAGVMWHVSQAAPMRRTRIVGNITLGTGWSSGGYLANSEVTGTLKAGSQQQWYSRNVDMGAFQRGAWNFVFTGCTGAPSSNCGANGGDPVTTIDQTPIIAEKPYIVIDDNGKYQLKRPHYKTNSQGHDWSDSSADTIDFSQVYVASDSDSASTINDKLSQGLHVVLQPGIYELDQALKVEQDGQVLLGLGMATLIPTTGNACIEVADGTDARIAGLLLEAGETKSDQLLKWGSTTSAGNLDAPGVISDVFARVGGQNNSSTSEVSADRMLELNNQHVILDHAWLWRADHDIAGLVEDSHNYSGTGLQVNADNVKSYGLFSEHHLGDLVEWNGNNGEVHFYQSELPYDVTQANFADKGFVGFKVDEDVTDFTGYGINVYSYFRDYDVEQPMGISVPAGDGIHLTNSFTRFLNGNGSIQHVINDQGDEVNSSSMSSYYCNWN